MEEYKSVLKFEKYMVNEIYFKYNKNYKETENGIPIKLDINPEVKTSKNNMNVTLICNIFENAEKNNYPFEMNISLTGVFSTIGEKVEIFVKNAIAILFPYVRAIVSTYTANANVAPLILPAINVNKLIEEQNEKKD